MNAEKRNIIWAVSFIVIGITTVILAGPNIMGIKLPDTVIRILGVFDLVSLPVLAFLTVKKRKAESEAKGRIG